MNWFGLSRIRIRFDPHCSVEEPLVSILTEEQTRINGEIAGGDVLVIFDGTTRLAEAVSDEYALEQRVLQLKHEPKA